VADDSFQEPSKTTLAQFFERWLKHMTSQVDERTHIGYAEKVRKNINPLLGSVLLTRLRPDQISEAYAQALASGRRDGKGGFRRVIFWFTSPEGRGRVASKDAIRVRGYGPSLVLRPLNCARPLLPQWVVCHERSRSKRRRATVREMKEGPSGSAIRC